MQEKILIVDDDQQLTSFLERFFRKHGFQPATAANATQMRHALLKDNFHLVVLDLILPDEDGFDLAKELLRTKDIRIIMLTARDELHDRIVGLELGADDYITKPYEPRELLARVRSVIRRNRSYIEGSNAISHTTASDRTIVYFANMEMNLPAMTLIRTDTRETIPLTNTEFSLLHGLVSRPGEVLTRDRIMETIYARGACVTDRAIDAHVARLRRKLEKGGTCATALIRTVHGEGYKLTANVIEGR